MSVLVIQPFVGSGSAFRSSQTGWLLAPWNVCGSLLLGSQSRSRLTQQTGTGPFNLALSNLGHLKMLNMMYNFFWLTSLSGKILFA